MSHTKIVTGIRITNPVAIQRAVAALQKQGVRCSLEQNAAPRMFYAGQHGKCAYVIRLEDSPYDVGLDLDATGNHRVVLDPWAGHIHKVLGAKSTAGVKKGTATERLAVGRFLAQYAREAAVLAAEAQGHTVDSIVENEDGSFDLLTNPLTVTA